MGLFTKRVLNPYETYYKQVLEFNKAANKPFNEEAQKALCFEEWKELREAYESKDEVAFLKELCDCFVVGAGGSATLTDIEVHYSVEGNIKDMELLLDEGGVFQFDLFLEDTIDIATQINADVLSALQEVCNSNMSKFCEYRPECLEDYDLWCRKIEREGRYKGVTWELNNGKVVFFDENKKILKGPDYFEPNLEKYINED